MINNATKHSTTVIYINHSLFDTNGLINPVQSGFRPMHCTRDVLLKTVDD